MNTFSRNILAVSIALCAGSVSAQGSANAEMGVAADVVSNCVIQAEPISFVTYDPVESNEHNPLDTTTTVRIRCTADSEVMISLDNGRHSEMQGGGEGGEGGMMKRRLAFEETLLVYDLFTDAARQNEWLADGPGVTLIGTGNTEEIQVYGRIAPGQNVPVGNYSDVVTATVNFF
jgi:spore coat protein U-like protein